MSISSNTLFTFLSMTFFPTYSFVVVIEATVDATSPRILLNLQSSALGATCPFSSQPLSVAVVELSNSDPPCCFNSPMTESGVGLAELC
ncbi:hypothetical protein B296_00036927 [Ensete ventricosum]|uniref:Uncharacterized protein n=1 Tax=Ensete ventricosum TaxID=4639 RepID=A0A426XBS2_ENSVE|nr:hypothetical protein B296_00036927 [Ensete ventricosum]